MMNRMNNQLLLILLLPYSALAAIGDVVWEDRFNTGTLDTDIWSYDLGNGVSGWGNQELQDYTSELSNVNVTSNKLIITARRNENGSGFTSGRIKTEGKMLFQYGRVEAMIQVPDVNEGLWPAFWTLGSNFAQVGWPRSGEIDIMEIGQGLAIAENKVNRRIISGAHWWDEQTAAFAESLDTQDDLFAQYRNYTLEWTPEYMTTYVDGAEIWKMDITSSSCPACTEFHQKHFLLLNLAVGGQFTSTGGSGSSSSAGVGSSSSGCAESSSARVGSSSSGGCGEARTDVTAPLPATMKVEYIKLFDNGHTQLNTPPPTPAPVDNVFEPTDDPIGQTEEGTEPPVMAPPTVSPTVGTPQIEVSNPTALPIGESVVDPDCREFTSGKSGKGETSSGKGSSRRLKGETRRNHRRRLCNESSESGKGKGKGKSSKKSKKSSDQLESRSSALNELKAQGSGASWNRSSMFSIATPLVLLLWSILEL